jgi:hypothetical protein
MQLLFITAIDILAASVFLYLLITLRDHNRRRGLPYPPGPPPLPIIGNLLDVPNDSPWAKYADTSKKYGKIYIPVIPFQVCSLHAQAMYFAFEFSEKSL